MASGFMPVVPLLAVAGLVALPHELSKGDVVRHSPSVSADDLVFPAGPTWGRLSFSRVSMARLYGWAPLRISAAVSLPPGYRPPAREGSDIDVLGTWNRVGDTRTYSVIVPPAMAVWAWPAMATEMLAWLGRHVVRQAQGAVLRAPFTSIRDTRSRFDAKIPSTIKSDLSPGNLGDSDRAMTPNTRASRTPFLLPEYQEVHADSARFGKPRRESTLR
jgi:hypothetical protein